MSEVPLTDVHTHLIPPLDDAQLALVGMERIGAGVGRRGHAIGPADLYHPQRLASWLEQHAVDRAIVSVPPPLYAQGRGPEAAAAWSRALNDALRAAVAPHERMLPFGYLPLDEPEAALAELERLAAEGWRGVTASAGGGSLAFDDARLAPLWGRLEQLGLPVLLHPGASADARLEPHYLGNLLGNPQETTLAVGQLVFGRVLERHPGVRIALVHGGGFVPAVAGRWQRGIDTSRPGTAELAGTRVRERLRRSVWADCIVHDEEALRMSTAFFGAERMLFGSDWPFPMGVSDAAALTTDPVFTRASAARAAAAFLGE